MICLKKKKRLYHIFAKNKGSSFERFLILEDVFVQDDGEG